MSHLLVTNDFPPKVGGIQVYLWELWRRLDPASFAVLSATSDPEAPTFDAEQRKHGFRIERVPSRVLLPTPAVRRRVRQLAAESQASLVVLDPALPLGLIGPSLGVPYALVLHGAEVTVPGRFPGARGALASVLGHAHLVICAGSYPADEARRASRGQIGEVLEIPPGVDLERFHPLGAAERSKARASFGLLEEGPLVVSVSRLVPRKGMDVLIEAVSAMTGSFPGLTLAIAGEGRDRARLERLARRSGCPTRFLGRVPDESLPSLVGAADVFAMACRNRWAGLEQEGFGIVFLEAASCGVPQLAGRSGGAGEAVVDGETGIVVDDPSDLGHVAVALRRLLSDEDLRRRLGNAARRRAEQHFGYDVLARRLAAALADVEG